jgi:DNA-directed RNA polymerase specialized sigma24 family protein
LARAAHGELLTLAAAGDQGARNELVDRFSQKVWSLARSLRLDDATAKVVSQTVWLLLVENMHRIDDPERCSRWLGAFRVKGNGSSVSTDFHYDIPDGSPSLEAILVKDEEAREVVAAFDTLSEDYQQLLCLLTADPPMRYGISELIGRPIGSLGPTRSRCLERLKAFFRRVSAGSEATLSSQEMMPNDGVESATR